MEFQFIHLQREVYLPGRQTPVSVGRSRQSPSRHSKAVWGPGRRGRKAGCPSATRTTSRAHRRGCWRVSWSRFIGKWKHPGVFLVLAFPLWGPPRLWSFVKTFPGPWVSAFFPVYHSQSLSVPDCTLISQWVISLRTQTIPYKLIHTVWFPMKMEPCSLGSPPWPQSHHL